MQNRMKQRCGEGLRRLFCGLLATAVFAGCVRDDIQAPADPVRSGELRMAFSVDDMDVATRAVATDPHERKVSDVHILFFDQSGNYITYQHATVPVGSSYFSFPIPEKLTANTSYRTLVIGNAHDHVPNDFRTFDEFLTYTAVNGDYGTIRSDLYAALNSSHHSVGESTVALPMWGEVQDALGAASDFLFSGNSGSGYTVSGRIRFWRSVCRLDLRHDAAKNLIIEKVKLVNFRKGGYYFHQDVPWARGSGAQLGGINDGTWIEVAAPTTLSGDTKRQVVEGKIYAFPNMVPVVVQNDALTTYLMIAGYYQDGTDNTPENPRNKLTYYRFNMAQNGRSQILRRNHCYKGIINRVSGPGAPSESEAEDASAPLLDYSVSDTWQDDDNTTVTDDRGNFLTVSRALVSFTGEQDLSEVVKVQVKEGLSWSVEWVQGAADAPDFAKFEFLRGDDASFSIRTREDNATEFLRKARLAVKATGGSVDSSNPLTAVVDVMQLSSKEEIKVLMVDNNVGTVEHQVPGSGATIRMQVQTGSKRSSWQAVDVDNTSGSNNISWTRTGANGGMLEVDVPANIFAKERTFSLMVQRVKTGGGVDEETAPVTIQFTQPKSDYLLTVTPSVPDGQDGLVINGFDPSPTTMKNGISAQQRFIVTLIDSENYEYCVKSTFNKDVDLFITKDSPLDKTSDKNVVDWTAHASYLDTLSNMVSGQSFYLNVFRTGPGDLPIRGTIRIYARPKNGKTVTEVQTMSMSVTIKTPCVVNDVLFKTDTEYLLVADRNVGAPRRIGKSGQFVTAKYFTNDAKVKITGSMQPENSNAEWKGEYYPWSDYGGKTGASSAGFVTQYWLASDIDGSTNVDDAAKVSPWYKSSEADQWRVPSRADQQFLQKMFVFSKQRAFLVSETKDGSGNYIGCYFPLAGSGSNPAVVEGRYWSTNRSNGSSSNPDGLHMFPDRVMWGNNPTTYMWTVRCVRTVTAEEFAAFQNRGL